MNAFGNHFIFPLNILSGIMMEVKLKNGMPLVEELSFRKLNIFRRYSNRIIEIIYSCRTKINVPQYIDKHGLKILFMVLKIHTRHI